MIEMRETNGADFLVRYYDQSELDRQYRPTDTVSEALLQQTIGKYQSLSRWAQETLPCTLSIPYGGAPDERLDIYRAGDGAPVFVYFHGGYWRALDSRDSAFLAENLTHLGVCVVVVNYTLAPSASLSQIVGQCRAALRWIKANIDNHGGDSDNIHVAGSSAGAHLAAMVGSADWGEHGLRPAIASLLLLSGLYDLAPLRLSFANEWLRLDPQDAVGNSPIHCLPPSGTRLIVSYGQNETDEFKRQTECYAAACAAVGCEPRFIPVADTNHFDLVFALCDKRSLMVETLRQNMSA